MRQREKTMYSEYVTWHQVNGSKELVGRVHTTAQDQQAFVDTIRMKYAIGADGKVKVNKSGLPVIEQMPTTQYYYCEVVHYKDESMSELMYN